jgi:hypothetical protein
MAVANKIGNDPILKGYFESFVQRIDNRMTIETINYYSVRVRQKLEKELILILSICRWDRR